MHCTVIKKIRIFFTPFDRSLREMFPLVTQENFLSFQIQSKNCPGYNIHMHYAQNEFLTVHRSYTPQYFCCESRGIGCSADCSAVVFLKKFQRIKC